MMSSATVGVSVVFTDLVGSTELATRVGAEQAEALRKTHFSILRDALTRFNGVEVKNLGDGIMAVFPGVAAAVDAACAMQQGFQRHSRRHPDRALRIRVGIAAGDCTEDDGDYFGEPIIQAARLCGVCDPEAILATEVIRMLAPRGQHEFLPRGDMDLKGIPEPVAVVEVVWSLPEVAENPVLPGRLAAPCTTRFVGRRRELETLTSGWNAAVTGNRRLVLLSGEAGLGKTRLLREFALAVGASGGVVHYGRSDEEVSRTYGAWRDALGPMIDEPTPGEDQFTMFARITERLCSAADEHPMLLVLDDLHWADRGTLQLLRHVASRTPSTPLMIVASFRDTDTNDSEALPTTLAALQRETGTTNLMLNGLSAADLTDMASDHGSDTGGQISALVQVVLVETAGNAFFASEAFRHLADTGGFTGIDLQTDRFRLPPTVRDVVIARVQHLGDRVRRTLTAASVAGREFDLGTVARAVGSDETDVLDDLELAQAAGLVGEVASALDRFTFTHALVQRTLYDDISVSRRARLHRALAEAIESKLGPRSAQSAGELALHWFEVGSDAVERAVMYSVFAGDQALTSAAPSNAVEWFRRAFDALPSDLSERRCEIMVRLGNAERLAGVDGYRERLLAAAHLARSLGRSDLLVQAALSNYRGFQSSANDRERIEVIEAALEASPEPSRDRARLLAVLSAELRFEGTLRYLELTREAIALARSLNDSDTLIDVLISSSFLIPHVLPERRAVAGELLALTKDGLDPIRRWGALHIALPTAIIDANGARVDELFREMIAIDDRLRQPTCRWVTSLWKTCLLTIAARDVEAEEAATEGLTLGIEAAQPDAMMYFGVSIMSLRVQRDRAAELIPLLQQAVEQYSGYQSFKYALVSVLAQAGNLHEAELLFEELAASDFGATLDQGWATSMVFAAEAACLLNDRRAAPILLERLEPFSDQVVLIGAMNCMGSIALWSGRLHALLGQFEQAERYIRSAVETNQRLGIPEFGVRSLAALADVVERRDPKEAIDLRAQAASMCQQYGLDGLRRLLG